MRCYSALAIMFAICLPVIAGLEAKAGQHEPEAVLLLEEVARRSAKIMTLSTDFRQEKKLGILEQPLTSQGYMCVTRASTTHEERLLWAYTNPAPAGFIYENGQGALWEAAPANRQVAGSQEGRVITTIVKHVMAWIQIDSQLLQQAYRLERPDKDMPSLLLHPRQQSFFTKLEVLFAPSLDSVRQLTFFEANGDAVRIFFMDVQINQPLPERCLP